MPFSGLPSKLIENQKLFDAFVNEIVFWGGDLHDESRIISLVLAFAHDHDSRDIARDILIGFDSDVKKEFTMKNFDWIFEGASEGWIIKAILGIEEIQKDQEKLDKLLRVLAQSSGGLEDLFISRGYESEQLKCSKAFVAVVAEWALSNVAIIKDSRDLRYLAYVATDEQFPRLLEALERKEAWRSLATLRVSCHGSEKRHEVEKILERNVDVIPVSVDLASGLSELDHESESGPSVFAIIGTIGIDENARLRAIERISKEGRTGYDIDTTRRILERIIKGHPRYRNATVEAAAEKALQSLK